MGWAEASLGENGPRDEAEPGHPRLMPDIETCGGEETLDSVGCECPIGWPATDDKLAHRRIADVGDGCNRRDQQLSLGLHQGSQPHNDVCLISIPVERIGAHHHGMLSDRGHANRRFWRVGIQLLFVRHEGRVESLVHLRQTPGLS